MADVFISYATEDRERARELAAALTERGWTVWWDREIPIGRSYTDVIERELAAAGCVMVLWSRESVQSSWVHNEAREGYSRHVLVPVLIEEVRPPLEFRHLQTASLVDWDADSNSPDFRAVEAAIRTFSRGGSVPGPAVVSREPRSRTRSLVAMIIGVAVVLLGLIAYLRWNTLRLVEVAPPDVDVASSTADTAATSSGAPASTVDTAAPPPGIHPTRPDPKITASLSGVGQVLVDGKPLCTAILVSRTRALMPGYCFTSPDASLVLRLQNTTYKLRVIVAETDRSFAIARLDRTAADTFAPLRLNAREARIGEAIVIAHYGPGTTRKTDRSEIINVRPDALVYELVTELGSMGAPVVAVSDGAVLGIHYGRDGANRNLKRAVPTTTLPDSIVQQIR